ncbi:MFS transporter [Rhodococcus zopfii]|uniref:MFS transporter n=1 Tax=Rhodococcus zopfii TaxID=43772 RepID=UPI001F0EBB31|nr:MFS transporter [Rhodococcus zopfii]
MTTDTHSPTLLASTHRRLLVAVFSVTSTVGFVAMVQILPVVLVPIAADLGTSRTAVAAASTVSTLMGALVAIPVGRILDRHGGRLVMTGGSAIGAVAVLLWSQVTSLAMLYVAFALIGLALVMSTYDSAFAVLVVATEPHERDQAILAVTMIAGLATYLVYPLLGWMVTEFGWRTTLVILAVTLAVTSIPAHLWAVPSRETHLSRVRRREGSPVAAALRRKRFWLLLIAFVAQAGSAAAFLLLIVAYLLDVGHSTAVATAVPIAVGALQILSRLILTTVARRVPIAKATAFAFAVQAAGLLLLPLAGLSIPLTLLCVAAVGLGQGVAVIARPSILADSFGVVHFASVLAAIAVPTALARAGLPLVASWLGDERFLVLCGVVSIVGTLALVPLLGQRRAHAG